MKNKKLRNVLIAIPLSFLCVCCLLSYSLATTQKQAEPTAQATTTESPTNPPQPTKTQSPPSTPTPAGPQYVSLLAKIWTGVKVYYGEEKAYGFEILGGSEKCSLAPSGRAVYVLYPDGSREWKDREYLLTSGIFFVEKDDPAVKRMEWLTYPCP